MPLVEHDYSDRHFNRLSRLKVESVLGRKLSPKHPVHHVNGIKSDLSNRNLVVCEDKQYHDILHQRRRAFVNCGKAHYRKCQFCTTYDDPVKMEKCSGVFAHHVCRMLDAKIRRQKKESLKCL